MPLSTDAIGLLLDSDGDLDLSQGLRFASGIDAVAQGIRSRIQMIRGEWFRDLELGVPYFEGNGVASSEALLGGRFSETYARDLFAAAIKGAPGVDSIVKLAVSLNASTRTLSVTWTARTSFGDLSGTTEA